MKVTAGALRGKTRQDNLQKGNRLTDFSLVCFLPVSLPVKQTLYYTVIIKCFLYFTSSVWRPVSKELQYCTRFHWSSGCGATMWGSLEEMSGNAWDHQSLDSWWESWIFKITNVKNQAAEFKWTQVQIILVSMGSRFCQNIDMRRDFLKSSIFVALQTNVLYFVNTQLNSNRFTSADFFRRHKISWLTSPWQRFSKCHIDRLTLLLFCFHVLWFNVRQTSCLIWKHSKRNRGTEHDFTYCVVKLSLFSSLFTASPALASADFIFLAAA